MKTYKIKFMSSDNVKKETEVVASSKKEALQIAKKNYPAYKYFN